MSGFCNRLMFSLCKLLPQYKSSPKDYWKSVRLSRKLLSHFEVCELSAPGDSRPHASVIIGNRSITGLLDSGASVSCFGKKALELAATLGLKIKEIVSSVRTADGARQKIEGFVEANVAYNGKVKNIRFYLIPSLSQTLYLGIDFWQMFGIAPIQISEIETSTTEPNIHVLNEDQSARLESVKSLFPTSKSSELSKTTLLQHSINVNNSKPIKQRHYPVSPAIQDLMYAELDRMVSLGVIEESMSPWNSPVVLVRKANGKARLCLDSRVVNNVTVKDAYPMPMINGIVSRLADTHYISSVDLKDAFWQIELEESSREITAFTVPGRPLYQFKRMPFGLCNAAQTMCRLMDRVIPTQLRENVFVYIDDLLVVSPDFDSHMICLRKVAECLSKANLTINVDKSKFCMKEIHYLGYIVGNGCLKTDPDKVQAISNFPTPKTKKQIRSFLGMAGWYQRFIANYAAIASPITDLIGKPTFHWTPEAQKAFETLKDCLTTSPVLSHPDFKRPFVIQCDASMTGVGSVLYQLDGDGNEHPIAFMSRKLNAAQRNYNVTELECLAAVLSVKKFRAYIEGMPFKIITDHASLKWLMSHKDLSGRLARWSLKLQSFDFEIEHKKGSANVVPDTLSRAFAEELTIENPNLTAIDLESPEFLSTEYLELKEVIETNQSRLPDLRIDGPRVFKRTALDDLDNLLESPPWKLWVPTALRNQLIIGAHNPPLSSHRGFAKTLKKVRRLYYWPGMSDDARNYVAKCDVCKETKAPNTTLRPPMGQQIVVEKPWQFIYVDLLGPYPRSKSGNTCLLIVLDKFSKFVLLKPLYKATAAPMVRHLEAEVFHTFGVPESLLSDNGVQFRSKIFIDLMSSYGVKHSSTATHSAQANASERVNRSILAAIRAYIGSDQQNWDVNISAIASSLRSTVHESTKYSPYYLVFGSQMVQHASAYEILRKLSAIAEPDMAVIPTPERRSLVHRKVVGNLRQAHESHEKAYNTRCKSVTFNPGQEVFRRNFAQSNFKKGFNAKLGKQWLKARVVRKKGTALYELEDLKGIAIPMTYHAKDLRS